MDDWEYLELGYELDAGVRKVRYMNDGELQTWKDGPDLDDVLSGLRQDGWEVTDFYAEGFGCGRYVLRHRSGAQD